MRLRQKNPYFYVFNAILSRSTVFEFQPITPEAAQKAVERAIAYMAQKSNLKVECEPGAQERIALACGGDLRKALNAVEVLFAAANPKDGVLRLTCQDASAITQRSAALRLDRDGDAHYDLLSALQKSIRGSDPDAAVHYLARLLEGGDMLSPIRRMLVIAAEDVGLAYPQAMPVVKACCDAALQLGLRRRRGFRWQRRQFSLPQRPSRTLPSAPLTQRCRICAMVRAGKCRRICRTPTMPVPEKWAGD